LYKSLLLLLQLLSQDGSLTLMDMYLDVSALAVEVFILPDAAVAHV
jgi:hypothetical protein